MASNTSHTSLIEPYIAIKMKMPYGVPSLGCPWCSSVWFKRLGDLQNHLSSVHDEMLRLEGINLTLQTNTSNSMLNAINPLPGNPTSFQPGNIGAIPNYNLGNSTPAPNSSQTSAFHIGSPPVALQSPQFKTTLPPQFPPQPRFSSQTQQSVPATRPISTPMPAPPPPPPSYCVQRQVQPPNGAFQLNNRTTSTMNGGVASPFVPPLPSNIYQGGASMQDLLDFGPFPL
ncbi:hypothetical protein F4813DRAFT_373172 [Daldinia decipiens]|uniref:uncharacterized protein n=1 Tax=Daldinia decipiens TaxID=326647 RepID=UPI0020C1DA70|nr:uncharacterized protein F4813DRAFT_373172 [Daldinia decipiens]KAI1653903.1 hypothetical protein F4813DRAFT_373172 [Daldinia decipiens]